MNALETFNAHDKWPYILEVANPSEDLHTSEHQSEAFKEYYRQEKTDAPSGFTLQAVP